jgi:hypothetical protein
MKKIYVTFLAAVFMIYGCATKKPANKPFKPDVYLNAAVVRVDTLTWVDNSRNRVIGHW